MKEILFLQYKNKILSLTTTLFAENKKWHEQLRILFYFVSFLGTIQILVLS